MTVLFAGTINLWVYSIPGFNESFIFPPEYKIFEPVKGTVKIIKIDIDFTMSLFISKGEKKSRKTLIPIQALK